MGYLSLEELFQRVREFESRLESYYATIRDQCSDEGVRLLTYYLSRHRRHLDQALTNFVPAEVARIGSVRLKRDIPFDPARGFKVLDTAPCDLRARELLEAAVRHDEQLVDAYRQILDQPLSRDVEALLQSLIRLEEKDIVMLKKMIAMDYF